MKRVLLVFAFLLALGATAFYAGALTAQQSPAPPPPAPSPTPPDPLQEFVPREKLDAESVVSFPVDI